MVVIGRRLANLVAEHKKTAITTIFGLIAGPIVGYLIIESITITPSDLASSLEGKASFLQLALTNSTDGIILFNNLRSQFKQPITLENLDLSNKNLSGANLNSITILHSNLSNTNLQYSELQNAQISGDLSEIDLRNATLLNADLSRAFLGNANLTDADLRGADLIGAILGGADLTDAELFIADLIGARLVFADLTNATLNLANLNEAIFDCNSLRSTNFAVVNASRIHIVDSNGNEVSNCN